MTVTPDPVTPDPVTPTAAPATEPVRPRRRPMATLASALLAMLALAILVAGVALGNLRPASQGVLVRYAGADSTAFVEARLDLPGDQRQLLLDFVRHFPGFEEQADIDRLVAHAFDEMAEKADEGLTWANDVEPWFGGQIAAFGTVPSDADDRAAEDWESVDAVVALSVRDRAAAHEFVSGRAANHDWTSETYRDATIWQGLVRREEIVLALSADALLAGQSLEAVRAALDVAAGESPALAAQPAYEEAVARLRADRLATMYLDAGALSELYRDRAAGMMGGGMWQTGTFSGVVVAELHAERDHLALTARVRPGAGDPPLPTSRTTDLAARMPSDGLFFVEMREVGVGLERALTPLLEQLGDVDEDAALGEQLEFFLGTPPAEFLGFLDDTALSATSDDGRYSGGLIATVTDVELAQERMQRLVRVLRTAASFDALSLTITEEQYAGATLTVIRLAGMPGVDDADADVPPLAFTISDGMLLLGVEDFVRDALDRGAQGGLAATSAYSSALEAAGGSENAGVVYVDLNALRDEAESMMDGRAKTAYEKRFRPYMAHFSRLIMVAVRDGEELVSRTLLYVE
jgi:hypothetical protein